MLSFTVSPNVISERSGEILSFRKRGDSSLRFATFRMTRKKCEMTMLLRSRFAPSLIVISERSGEILSFWKRGDFSLHFKPIE